MFLEIPDPVIIFHLCQARVKEMEEEAEKLKELQAETEKTMGMQTSPTAAGS